MSQPDNSRLALELELLVAMYPDQIAYSPRSRDLKYTEQAGALQLRIPEHYPDAGFPDVLSARNAAKKDLRDQTKEAVTAAGLVDGEEALDVIIACFERVIETNSVSDSQKTGTSTSISPSDVTDSRPESSRTVIVWLHHLLALSKRKLALSPASPLSGITKPGYPGVLIFSGDERAVKEHVDILKRQNWQAFQVRYESAERWVFGHGEGVREVESMAEVVKAVEGGDEGNRQRGEFLRAVGIK